MTTVVKQLQKTVVERRRLYLDYTCWLEELEKLTDIQVTVSPYTEDGPLTLDTAYTDITQKKIMMFVAGGVGNTKYILQMVVRTDAGQIKRDDIGLRVLP